MNYLLRRLQRIAARRGLRGEHWAWFVLAGAAFLLRRSQDRDDPIVASRRLLPGESILVTLRDPRAADNRADEPQPAS